MMLSKEVRSGSRVEIGAFCSYADSLQVKITARNILAIAVKKCSFLVERCV